MEEDAIDTIPRWLRILQWSVGAFLVLGIASVGYGVYHAAQELGGPKLSAEARAEIAAADCDQLRPLAAQYSPNADSVRDAHTAEKLIQNRLLAECARP